MRKPPNKQSQNRRCGFPDDDTLVAEATRLMYAIWNYGPVGMDRAFLIKLAKKIRTGEVVTCPEFLTGANWKRRWVALAREY